MVVVGARVLNFALFISHVILHGVLRLSDFVVYQECSQVFHSDILGFITIFASSEEQVNEFFWKVCSTTDFGVSHNVSHELNELGTIYLSV